MSKHLGKNKKKKPIKGEYGFAVSSSLTLVAKPEQGVSALKECNVQIYAAPDIEKQWRNRDGSVNKAGMRAQTQGLIQGLIANIHYAHQEKMWDSAEHLRYIIENLEKGFAHATMEVTKGLM